MECGGGRGAPSTRAVSVRFISLLHRLFASPPSSFPAVALCVGAAKSIPERRGMGVPGWGENPCQITGFSRALGVPGTCRSGARGSGPADVGDVSSGRRPRRRPDAGVPNAGRTCLRVHPPRVCVWRRNVVPASARRLGGGPLLLPPPASSQVEGGRSLPAVPPLCGGSHTSWGSPRLLKIAGARCGSPVRRGYVWFYVFLYRAPGWGSTSIARSTCPLVLAPGRCRRPLVTGPLRGSPRQA